MKPERLSDARVASITKKESGFSVPFLKRFIKCLKSISDELLNETIFFLYGFFFMNILESQDCRGRGRAFQ